MLQLIRFWFIVLIFTATLFDCGSHRPFVLNNILTLYSHSDFLSTNVWSFLFFSYCRQKIERGKFIMKINTSYSGVVILFVCFQAFIWMELQKHNVIWNKWSLHVFLCDTLPTDIRAFSYCFIISFSDK